MTTFQFPCRFPYPRNTLPENSLRFLDAFCETIGFGEVLAFYHVVSQQLELHWHHRGVAWRGDFDCFTLEHADSPESAAAFYANGLICGLSRHPVLRFSLNARGDGAVSEIFARDD